MTAIAVSKINSEKLTELFNSLKTLYDVEKISNERRKYIKNLVKKYGYLPYPHIKALEELTPAETIVGIEEKLKLNNTFNGVVFDFKEISAVGRAGYMDSSWIKTEQHDIKLVNLAGLGNGNSDPEPGKFIDWLKQLLILPSGNPEKGILATTMYLIPFHPRDFGCAYLPTSSEVSPNLEDKLVREKLDLDAKGQVQLFLTLAQLAGHPTMYDVLPQTGRFSKTVLAHPFIARWFDIKALIQNLQEDTSEIAENLKNEFHWGDVDYIKDLISRNIEGDYEDIPENLKHLEEKFEAELDHKRKWYSNEMLTKHNQEILHQRAKKIINSLLHKSENEDISEKDIKNSGEIIGELISHGLWPAPGGAWCSAGIPIFNKMSENGSHPLFKHYDYKGNDVTELANLDCQTPFYFVYLENGNYNGKVIEFYLNFLKKIRSDYNFDSFRVDHIDHIADKFSENEQGQPISYRAPRHVLGIANTELKKDVPYFAALAEYMLWDTLYYQYHRDMNFDLLWGSDIVSQYQKNVKRIIEDNAELSEYNSKLGKDTTKLSILKTYNNQDGEFRAIDQYPGQLGSDGALFKWFKFKFLPGANLGQRPVLYIDGDESFTKTGIEHVIGVEESMKRNNDYEFFRKFDAINRFAMNNELTGNGIAEIYQPNDGSGFVSWYIRNESDKERLFIAANENSPTEIVRNPKPDGSVEIIFKENWPINGKDAYIPEGFKLVSEYILPENSLDFEEKTEVLNNEGNKIWYDKLNSSEYHIYRIKKM